MPEFIFIHDLIDPNDPEGRSYREVNRTRQHAFPIGSLVEVDHGVRLFVALHTRDCDQTPLYSLTIVPMDEWDREADRCYTMHGFSEDGMILIAPPTTA